MSGTLVQAICFECGERHIGLECPTCGTVAEPCCAHGKQTGKTKADPCWACADEASNRAMPRELRRD